MGITHSKVSEIDDGADTSQVRPSDWNADHKAPYSPDYIPSNPSAYDDEFEAALSGWTTLGSPDTSDANVIPSHYHVKLTSAATWRLDGIYKAIPSMPFTVTMKVSEMSYHAIYQRVALMLLESSPGKILEFGPMYWTSGQMGLGYGIWANRTTRSTFVDAGQGSQRMYHYIRAVVTSSTSVTLQASQNGMVWRTIHNAINPNFTIGNVGIVCSTQNQATTIEGVVDWIRFT